MANQNPHFEEDDIMLNLHIELAWAAVVEVLHDPSKMQGIDYQDFCEIYKREIRRSINRHHSSQFPPPQMVM